MTTTLLPAAPPVPHPAHGADPVDVSRKQVPHPAPHQVLPEAPPKTAGLAAAVYTPAPMPACHAKAELPAAGPQPQAPFVPS